MNRPRSGQRATAEPCPCGGLPAGTAYEKCCGRFLGGGSLPDSAEQLMRSRYTAYVRGDAGWLLASWHPRTRPAELDFSAPQPRWLGLTVHAHQELDAGHAEVEFTARYKIGGRAHRLHERSRFERLAEPGAQARWYYLDGIVDDGAAA